MRLIKNKIGFVATVITFFVLVVYTVVSILLGSKENNF